MWFESKVEAKDQRDPAAHSCDRQFAQCNGVGLPELRSSEPSGRARSRAGSCFGYLAVGQTRPFASGPSISGCDGPECFWSGCHRSRVFGTTGDEATPGGRWPQ
ncbi:hypothetical protein MTO96_007771 [Rhipicephalus appendiculatus]